MWWDKPNPNQPPAKEREPLPFMKWRSFGYLISLLIIVGTTISLATQGLNMGLDFTGGIQIEATRESGFDAAEVRNQLSTVGYEPGNTNVTTTPDRKIVFIRLPIIEGAQADIDTVARQVTGVLGQGVTIRGASAVSGKVSDELLQGGVIACIFALVAIAGYIWFRFESKFGWAAFITTFHDVYAILGLFSITQMTFDLTIVAGALTLAGYSINDKVVVFDRIREMLKKYKKLPLPRIIDISITATLSRTLITSLATMMAGGAMLFLGGDVLFGFAASICFGIVIGTYSSIFVAAPLLITLPGRVPGQRVEKTEDEAAAVAT
jgi:preprotein translocase subunit SecF